MHRNCINIFLFFGHRGGKMSLMMWNTLTMGFRKKNPNPTRAAQIPHEDAAVYRYSTKTVTTQSRRQNNKQDRQNTCTAGPAAGSTVKCSREIYARALIRLSRRHVLAIMLEPEQQPTCSDLSDKSRRLRSPSDPSGSFGVRPLTEHRLGG